jgi:hypothetical protein
MGFPNVDSVLLNDSHPSDVPSPLYGFVKVWTLDYGFTKMARVIKPAVTVDHNVMTRHGHYVLMVQCRNRIRQPVTQG